MLDYAQLLGMNGGNAQAATLMQNALQPGVSLLNDAGPTPVGQNPMTGGPSRFSMGTAIGQAGQAGTLMGQASQQVAAAPPIVRATPIAPIPWAPPVKPQAAAVVPRQPPAALKEMTLVYGGQVPGFEHLYMDPSGYLNRYDPATQQIFRVGSGEKPAEGPRPFDGSKMGYFDGSKMGYFGANDG